FNPYITTIQSNSRFVDRAYFMPIESQFLERVIERERPDGILLGFGGQTALNAGMDLNEKGVLSKYKVQVLGTGTAAIEAADNRSKFRQLMIEKGLPIPKSRSASTVEESQAAAREIGFPVMVRVAYALGGQGTGVAHNDSELGSIVSGGLAISGIGQVRVKQYRGK